MIERVIRRPAAIVFIVQVATTIVISMIGFVFYSPLTSQSNLIGGLVAIVPQSLFSFWAFRECGARNASLIARNFFFGEGLKLTTTVFLFIWIWSTFDQLISAAVLAGFILTVLVGQLGLPLVLGGVKHGNRN